VLEFIGRLGREKRNSGEVVSNFCCPGRAGRSNGAERAKKMTDIRSLCVKSHEPGICEGYTNWWRVIQTIPKVLQLVELAPDIKCEFIQSKTGLN
jgi:hypothetical protein